MPGHSAGIPSGCATSGRLQTRIAPVADVVRVNRIQLVDASGRAGTGLRRNTAAIGMFVVDESGGTRSGVAQFSHGGGRFALHGPDMRGAAVSHLKGSGSPTLCDETGNDIESAFFTRPVNAEPVTPELWHEL
jgi:hypothetical protein